MHLKTRGFHHITMVSADAPRTVRFYRDLLGLGLVKRTVNFDDPGSYHLYFGDAHGTPGTLLTFFEWRRVRRGHSGVGGVHHLALAVESAGAQLKWKRRLEDAGIRVTGPYDRGWFQGIHFVDPDGHVVEIASGGPLDAAALAADDAQASTATWSIDEPGTVARTWPEPVPDITPDMRLDGLHHITAVTDDLAQADEFYDRALGLRVVEKSVNRDDGRTPHWFWARAVDGRVEPRSALSLFEWRDSTYFARPGVGQTHHVAFRAATDDEQLAWLDRLRTIGVHVTPVQDRTYFHSIYFRAPDGLLLEIATDSPGFAVDEREGQLGMVLKLPAWLEAERGRLVESLVPLP